MKKLLLALLVLPFLVGSTGQATYVLPASMAVSQISESGYTATATVLSTSTLIVGNYFMITDVTDVTAYNGLWTIATIPNGTTLTFTMPTSGNVTTTASNILGGTPLTIFNANTDGGPTGLVGLSNSDPNGNDARIWVANVSKNGAAVLPLSAGGNFGVGSGQTTLVVGFSSSTSTSCTLKGGAYSK